MILNYVGFHLTKMELHEIALKGIQKDHHINPSTRLLVAVSGGMDSMVLLHCLTRCNLPITVAHVNYGLRGIESDMDQQLVVDFCEQHNIACHVRKLEKKETAYIKKANSQERAREIRYRFFDQKMKEENCQYLCTAHHQTDAIETFFINTLRVSGSTGMTSMLLKKDRVIRPFIDISKDSIEDYAQNNNIPYRHDKSNFENNYLRNRIRNKVIPMLDQVSPGAEQRVYNSLQLLSDENKLLNHYYSLLNKRHLIIQSQETIVDSFEEILKIEGHLSYLHFVLSPFGYHVDQIKQLIATYQHKGNIYESATHQLIYWQGKLICKKKNDDFLPLQIERIGEFTIDNNQLLIEAIDPLLVNYIRDDSVIYIDRGLIKFPFTVRSYQRGDRFQPFGMSGHSKKLSDLFQDMKLNYFDKKNIKLLCQGNQIVWVIGHRMDHRFRITEHTEEVLQLKWKKSTNHH